jgi:hypothetical protein
MNRSTQRAGLWLTTLAALALVAAACTSTDTTPTPTATTPAATAPAATPDVATPGGTPDATASVPTPDIGTPDPSLDACANLDPAMLDASFVLITTDVGGMSVVEGMVVSGCSRTFESTVEWRLIDRNGDLVAGGHTMGGGVDGAGPFEFTVGAYSVAEAQAGHLEVVAPDPSGGEGFPPSTHRIPVILTP